MAGQSWKQGVIPTHLRMTPEAQATSLLLHVDHASARSIALRKSHELRTRLSTYTPEAVLDLPTARDLKIAAEFWHAVSEHLAHPMLPMGLDR